MTTQGAGSRGRITIQPYRGALIASVQIDVDDDVLRTLQMDLLEAVRARASNAVYIDLAGVELLDPEDFAGLRRAIDAVSLMGAETVLCGIRPGVAASLVRMGAPVEGLRTALSLDAALADHDRASPEGEQAQDEDEPDLESEDEHGRVQIRDPE